jgi:CheY-like chemotaxis protein
MLEGHQVTECVNMEQAVRALDGAQFDALVCDLAMPSIDGFEVLQSIQEHDRESGRSTRALALTAHASSDFRTRVLAAGFRQHIVKPYEQTALIAAVAGLFSGPGLAPGGRGLSH